MRTSLDSKCEISHPVILFYHPYVFYNISMRRYLFMIFILFFLLTCQVFAIPLIQPAATYTPTLPSPTSITIYPTSPSAPTSTSTPTPTPLVATTTPSPRPPLTPPGESFSVLYHPDDVLYVGDQISIEVISPPGLDMKDATVQVQVDPPAGPNLGAVKFSAWGIQGRDEATLLWAWDTHDQAPGAHTLAFSIQPPGYAWSEQVTLLPTAEMPPDQADAQWATTQSPCCTIFYITNTASERDLAQLSAQIDEQGRLAMEHMDANFTQPITITVLPRLLGHGGFTSSEISVSYLDRNYAANSWSTVVHHEMIHAIDAHSGGDFRPTIFVEGLAVYLTGGHYKAEPLMPRAAALLKGYLDWYIPLKMLADGFYDAQHEIGYMEGASLIEYMVETYGEGTFLAFYRDIHIQEGESQSGAIDAALKAHFSVSFDDLEQAYLAALAGQPDTTDWVDDVRLTVTFFDTVRRYQLLLDPSAYFRTAWLLDNKSMRARGIVADYLRHPHTPINLALETLFISASQHMSDRQYADAARTLEVISAVLDAIEHGTTDPFSVSMLAADYYSISTALQRLGYEVQTITVSGDSATTKVTTATGPDLVELQLRRSGGEWSLSSP
ncbi:MAG: hypothetical protein A2136_03255 [Chloroflexi bacterium RBG_16_54_11]|nr:MAG: hypothetical protein A2136_03255 [Chloroflexi bacterium RBG_16_54_11]